MGRHDVGERVALPFWEMCIYKIWCKIIKSFFLYYQTLLNIGAFVSTISRGSLHYIDMRAGDSYDL